MALGKVIKPPVRPPKGLRKPKEGNGAPSTVATADAALAAAPVTVAAAPRFSAPMPPGGPRPGRKPTGEVEDEKVLTWPDLVYTELICMSVFSAVLLVVCWLARSPLEEIANPNHTPNPSKAPWYFVGLQEMLVYFDPWIAGVVLPTTIIVGLMAIPYVDRNPTRGSGYYNWSERKFAWLFFVGGFATWWILIIIGNGLRGPGWAWYWPVLEHQHHVKVVIEGQMHHPHLGEKGTPLGNFFDAMHLDHLPVLGKIGQKREEDGSVGRLGICLPGILLFLGYCALMCLLPAKWRDSYFPELWRRRWQVIPITALGCLLIASQKIAYEFFNISIPEVAAAAAAAAGFVLVCALPIKLATEKGFFPLLPRGEVSPFYRDLGFMRYAVTMLILLQAFGLPAKMIARLVVPWHLKYVVVTPWFYI